MKESFDVDDWQEQPRRLLEKDVQSACVRKARRAGWWARKFSAAPGNTSVPDYIFAKNGHVIFVEFKAPGEQPTEKQQDEHNKMRKDARLIVYVCDSIEYFDSIMAAEEMYAKSR